MISHGMMGSCLQDGYNACSAFRAGQSNTSVTNQLETRLRVAHTNIQRRRVRRVDRKPVPTPVAVALILMLGRYADVAAATACVPAKSVCNCHHFSHVFRGSRDCLCLCGIEGADFVGGFTCEAEKRVCEKRPQPSAGPDGRLRGIENPP
jgi:hypothetical protein